MPAVVAVLTLVGAAFWMGVFRNSANPISGIAFETVAPDVSASTAAPAAVPIVVSSDDEHAPSHDERVGAEATATEDPIDLTIHPLFDPRATDPATQGRLHDLSHLFWFLTGRLTDLQRSERRARIQPLVDEELKLLRATGAKLCDRFYQIHVRIADITGDRVIGAFSGNRRAGARWTLLVENPDLDLAQMSKKESWDFVVYLARFEPLAEFAPLFADLHRMDISFEVWAEAALQHRLPHIPRAPVEKMSKPPVVAGFPSYRDEIGFPELFGIIVGNAPTARPSSVMRERLGRLQLVAAYPG